MPYLIPKRKPRRRMKKVKNPRNVPKGAVDLAALLIGIEYTNYARQRRAERLPGCHKDIVNMSSILQTRYGVDPKNMVILMDDGKHTGPTKSNIVRAIRDLMTRGKKLFLVYSGHGSHQRDRSGDEKDGQDEMLVPSDYLDKGFIVDDDIRAIVSTLKDDQCLCTILDCCHSGSMLDLPWTFEKVSKNPLPVKKSCSKLAPTSYADTGKVLCLSACTDQQTSISAYNLDKKNNWQGAMTFAFSQLPYSNADGKTLLLDISKCMEQRGFDQITCLSTNLDVEFAENVSFPF